jgi:hypothetical protein
MKDTRTRLHLCPSCDTELTHKGDMFGQNSFMCMSCDTYGDWADRKTIRNPANPKRKERRRQAREAQPHVDMFVDLMVA